MNNRKNQNSVLGLATLGVYLGLVLAGATPQILAQAAMTKEFSVKDEVEELNDDLLIGASNGLEDFFEDTERLLKELEKLDYRSLPVRAVVDIRIDRVTHLSCVEKIVQTGDKTQSTERTGLYNDTTRSIGPESIWSEVNRYSHRVGSATLSDCFTSCRFEGAAARETKHDVRINDDGFSVQVTFTKSSERDANNLLRALRAAIEEISAHQKTKLIKLLLQHTELRSENDQVSIILHLPRAGLDALLAKDAK